MTEETADDRKAANARATVHMYSWSALCRLWRAVRFARGTSYEQTAVNAFKAVEQFLDEVEAEARQQRHPLNRPPLDEGTDEEARAQVVEEGWPGERPKLPRDA